MHFKIFCPKQGQGFKPSAAQLCSNIGRVLLPHPFPSSVSCHLYNIRRRIRKYLTGETTQSPVFAIVMGRTAYCNSLLFNTPAKHIAKIQRIQSCADRLVCRTLINKFDHITPTLSRLDWLPVRCRIEYTILILNFKAIYGVAPSYICNLIKIKERTRYNLRSSKGTVVRATIG